MLQSYFKYLKQMIHLLLKNIPLSPYNALASTCSVIIINNRHSQRTWCNHLIWKRLKENGLFSK